MDNKTPVLLDGKALSAKVRAELSAEAKKNAEKYGRPPCLVVILVGEDPASQIYVRNKEKACEDIGYQSRMIVLPTETSEDELLALIDELNADKGVDGILVQSPLPKQIDAHKVAVRIAPEKDVDAFHPANVGLIALGRDDGFKPCTPAGVIRLLKEYNIPIAGKDCVVVGRSNIVGKPMALLLVSEGATVTVCNSKTKDLGKKTAQADILVVAVGKAGLITADMVKEGAVVVDVGMNRSEGKLCGDVAFDEVAPKCSYITPVPGGVGPMTIAMLMENALKSQELNQRD